MNLLTPMPDPQYVMAAEGHRIATYTWGDERDPAVLAVHGFASSTKDNWVATGWVRDLVAAGFYVLGVDQRGHGLSDKPHDPREYSMTMLTNDLLAVLDTYLVDEAAYLGYSLGGRVGWQLMGHHPEHITRGVLGGIPDGRPLRRLNLEQAKAYAEHGAGVDDEITRRYVTLAERLPSNDLHALLALAEGMKLHDDVPPMNMPPTQPTLIATGSDDPILEDSQTLAGVLPDGQFYEIPGRNHVKAPSSREFRARAVEFLLDR